MTNFINKVALFKTMFWLHLTIIFSLVPLGRTLERILRSILTEIPWLRTASLLILLVIICVTTAIYIISITNRNKKQNYWLSILLTIPITTGLLLTGLSVETIHLVLFALLVILLTLAYNKNFFIAVTLATGIGVCDELLQWIHPERIFDFRDILINLCGAIIGGILSAQFINRA